MGISFDETLLSYLSKNSLSSGTLGDGFLLGSFSESVFGGDFCLPKMPESNEGLGGCTTKKTQSFNIQKPLRINACAFFWCGKPPKTSMVAFPFSGDTKCSD